MSPTSYILLFHPVVALTYCCIAMVLAMACIQPALSAIAFACVASFGLLAFGVRSFARRLLWQLPVMTAITALNGLFVQRGATVLFSVGDFGLHGESLLYGLSMGLALVTAMELVSLLGDFVDGDEVLSLFGKRFPATALLASMAIRLIPSMKRSAEERRDVLKACTALPSSGDPLRGAAEEVSVMVANAMEDSLITADSMRARGYGSGKDRTQYRRRSFARSDGAALACVLGLGVLASIAAISAMTGFAFYPRITGGPNAIECVTYAAFFLLPHEACLAGLAKWRQGNRSA